MRTRNRTNQVRTQSGDSALGLNARICRRDFLNSALLASGSALLKSLSPLQLLGQVPSWGGYSGEGDYAGANGNTEEVLQAGHAVRDGAYDSAPAAVADTGEIFDLAIVGGGISGLAAALFFKDRAQSKQTCLVLDNHPIFGGQARRNEFIVDGIRLMAPQGSNWFWIPASSALIDAFYERIGVDWREFQYQKWAGPGPEMPLSRTSYHHARNLPSPPNFGFHFGQRFGQRPGTWLADPWKNLEKTPLSTEMRSDFARYLGKVNEYHQLTKRPRRSEAELRGLDAMTAEEVLIERCSLSRDFIRLFVAPHTAAAIGLGPDALSGYFFEVFGSGDNIQRHSFPGGNTGFTRHVVKTLIPEAIPGPRTLEAVCRNRVNFAVLDRPGEQVRIRVGSTVVRVEHEGEPEKSAFVRISYLHKGQVYQVKARAVVMAGGGWITKHVVRDLPSGHRDAYNQFNYSATLVANVAIRNWRFLHKQGLSGGRWFEGFGYWTEVRTVATFGSDSTTIGPDSPTVLSLIVPLFYPGQPAAVQCSKGRAELLSTSFREYERRVREQFTELFSRSGFDARKDIAGMILNRWGHHFVVPQPGFMYGKDGKPAAREILREKPFGRIAFAHTDLTGHSGHNLSIEEAHRAVTQLLAVL
jgi:spermidine dehydrogenase